MPRGEGRNQAQGVLLQRVPGQRHEQELVFQAEPGPCRRPVALGDVGFVDTVGDRHHTLGREGRVGGEVLATGQLAHGHELGDVPAANPLMLPSLDLYEAAVQRLDHRAARLRQRRDQPVRGPVGADHVHPLVSQPAGERRRLDPGDRDALGGQRTGQATSRPMAQRWAVVGVDDAGGHTNRREAPSQEGHDRVHAPDIEHTGGDENVESRRSPRRGRASDRGSRSAGGRDGLKSGHLAAALQQRGRPVFVRASGQAAGAIEPPAGPTPESTWDRPPLTLSPEQQGRRGPRPQCAVPATRASALHAVMIRGPAEDGLRWS